MKTKLIFFGIICILLISGCESRRLCFESPTQPKFIDDTSTNILQNHFNISEGEEIEFDCRISNPSKDPSPEEIGEVYEVKCEDLKFNCKVLNITYGTEYQICGEVEYIPTYLGLGDCYE